MRKTVHNEICYFMIVMLEKILDILLESCFAHCRRQEGAGRHQEKQ